MRDRVDQGTVKPDIKSVLSYIQLSSDTNCIMMIIPSDHTVSSEWSTSCYIMLLNPHSIIDMIHD